MSQKWCGSHFLRTIIADLILTSRQLTHWMCWLSVGEVHFWGIIISVGDQVRHHVMQNEVLTGKYVG